uniref:DNA polymerase III subunit delta n=1 Tax=Candidatus Kentrum sp. TC TaxID=2126339 RepID=A0A451AGB9_9GAMM|nr:MAG: DNA polymerase-3 subunit delta [Candidatus Kentron sp. TC]VFK52638.1 MAG: DNA polymerase III, delta subunit [Candidatus Kentron sp. TC]VFK65080.1 MAG: DNA polymerase-3 subunit delta [Candidatus Kentron sp. TC]
MQIKLEQLPAHLRSGLAAAYVISGDEFLQTTETLDVILRSASNLGFTERLVFHADNRFDWNIVGRYIDSLSLFAEKRLLDIRLPNGNIGRQGTDVIAQYASRLYSDRIIILSTGQLDAKQRKSKWYKCLEKVGVSITIWPVDSRNLPQWINARVLQRSMTITSEAAKLLADRVEGNLLGCAQEIEKLALLGDTHDIDEQNILECVIDSAHFESFALVDSTLAGDATHTVRILLKLAEEGTDTLSVLGILVWEIREIVRISGELICGIHLEQAISKRAVWYRRKKVIESALSRHNWNDWVKIFHTAECVDKIIKGAKEGDSWDALLGLALLIVDVKSPFLSTLHPENSLDFIL